MDIGLREKRLVEIPSRGGEDPRISGGPWGSISTQRKKKNAGFYRNRWHKGRERYTLVLNQKTEKEGLTRLSNQSQKKGVGPTQAKKRGKDWGGGYVISDRIGVYVGQRGGLGTAGL